MGEKKKKNKENVSKENINNKINENNKNMNEMQRLETLLENINDSITKSNFVELSYIIGNKKEIFIRNIWAGVSRGIGIGIGVTIITAIIIILLQKIVTLNIPIIGEYIGDIVEIVEKSN